MPCFRYEYKARGENGLTGITYSDSSGDSLREAVEIIGAQSSAEGIHAEYLYITRRLGRQGKNWKPVMQRLIEKKGRRYDRIDVRLADGTESSYYFDITGFFGSK